MQKTLMRTFLILLAGFLLTGKSYAQDNTKSRPNGGWFWVEGGYSLRDFSSLNSALEPGGFGSFTNNELGLGFGANAMVSGIIFGVSRLNYAKREAMTPDNYVQVNNSQNQFSLGYAVISTPNLLIYPRLGFGSYQQEILLREEDTPGSFLDVVVDPGAGAILKRDGFLLEPGIGIQFLPGGQKRNGGFIFGLEVAYTLAPGSDDWTLWERPVVGGPAFSPNGLLLRASIGLGGWK